MKGLVNKCRKLDTSKFAFVIVNACAFLIMFILTHQSKLYSDDNHLLSIVDGYEGGIINKAVIYATDYYLTWGGRCVAAFLRVIFATQNKAIYDLVNACMYVLLCNIIYAFAYPFNKAKNTFHTGVLTLIYCLLWFTLPTFGEVTIWLTGSIAYMWFGFFLVLFVFLLLSRLTGQNDEKCNVKKESIIVVGIKTVLMLIIGFLASCTSEPSACMLVVMSFFWTCYMFKTKKKITIWEWAGIVGAVLGFILLFTAPGIYVRSDAVTVTGGVLSRYVYRFARQTYYSAKYLLVPLTFALAPTLLDESALSIKEYLLREKEQLVLICMAFFNVYVMVLSPGASHRIFFTSVVLIVAAAGISYRKHVAEKATLATGFFLIMFTLLTLTSITTAYISCEKTGEPLEMQMDYNADDKIGDLF